MPYNQKYPKVIEYKIGRQRFVHDLNTNQKVANKTDAASVVNPEKSIKVLDWQDEAPAVNALMLGHMEVFMQPDFPARALTKDELMAAGLPPEPPKPPKLPNEEAFDGEGGLYFGDDSFGERQGSIRGF